MVVRDRTRLGAWSVIPPRMVHVFLLLRNLQRASTTRSRSPRLAPLDVAASSRDAGLAIQGERSAAE